MCDDGGLCEHGEKMKATARTVARALWLAVDDDYAGALEVLYEALGESSQDGFSVLVALAHVARTYFEMTLGPASEGWGLKAVSGPDMHERDIEELAPGPVFAARFVTAYANGDFDMCTALFQAALGVPETFADGLSDLFRNCVHWAKEIAAGKGVL